MLFFSIAHAPFVLAGTQDFLRELLHRLCRVEGPYYGYRIESFRKPSALLLCFLLEVGLTWAIG
jgi:hypothetical protein